MRFPEYASYDALGLAELVAKGDVSASELVEEAVARIEKHNPVLNAVIYKVYDEARKIAKEQPAPGSGGAFQGVPFLLKDILAEWKPAPTASGCRFFAGASASFDAELVVRYLRAGLIPLGRTNAPELGILPTTEPQFYGPCHNPWNTLHSTGGSSGGSAAAVAAGIVPVAHANDGGGSIRIPAACCGLVGLKPTRGRNPLGPIFGDLMDGLVSEHVVSRTVRDSAAMLDCTAGPDVGDPYWAPPPERPYLEEVSRDPGRRRLAYTSRTFTDKPVHPDCVAAMEKTARLCQGLGHEVEDASPPVDMDQVGGALRVLFTSNAMASINLMAFATGRKPSPEFFEPLTWALYEEGKETSGAQYQIAVTVMQMASRKIAAFFEDYDAWISPTLGAPPAPLGTIDANETNLDKAIETLLDYVPFTPVFNMTGQPAVSLPLHANDDGLPIGVHVVGRFGDEGLLYRLSGQLEKECPWIDRKPPIWD